MRIVTLAVAAAFLIASGAAMACPMQTASKNQTVASSNNSTPIPKAGAGNS
ncbi:MAG: hypothetical protein AB7I59_24095 [Geminicoccaceae bacterium]